MAMALNRTAMMCSGIAEISSAAAMNSYAAEELGCATKSTGTALISKGIAWICLDLLGYVTRRYS